MSDRIEAGNAPGGIRGNHGIADGFEGCLEMNPLLLKSGVGLEKPESHFDRGIEYRAFRTLDDVTIRGDFFRLCDDLRFGVGGKKEHRHLVVLEDPNRCRGTAQLPGPQVNIHEDEVDFRIAVANLNRLFPRPCHNDLIPVTIEHDLFLQGDHAVIIDEQESRPTAWLARKPLVGSWEDLPGLFPLKCLFHIAFLARRTREVHGYQRLVLQPFLASVTSHTTIFGNASSASQGRQANREREQSRPA